MKLRGLCAAAVLAVGMVGLLALGANGLSRIGPDTGSTPAAAVGGTGGGSGCAEWQCGTNHNEVLL